jgi:hypothetical protein
MSCFACYNNDVNLWKNMRESILSEDPPLRCKVFAVDGHLIHKREVLARCFDQEAAEELLVESGFLAITRTENGSEWKA